MRKNQLSQLRGATGNTEESERELIPQMSPADVLAIAQRGGSICWIDGTIEDLSIGPQRVVLAMNRRSKKSHRMALHEIYHCTPQLPLSIVAIAEPQHHAISGDVVPVVRVKDEGEET